MSGRVAWISRTPVKAFALQHLEEAELGEGGVEGDRHFYLVSAAGRLISNKDFPAFQLIHASYDEEREVLTFTLTDGREVTGTIERGAEVETTFHSRPRTARLVLGQEPVPASRLVVRTLLLRIDGDEAVPIGRLVHQRRGGEARRVLGAAM